MSNLNEIEDKILGEIWARNKTRENIATLVDTIGTPMAGTKEEKEALEYLRAKFEEYGLDNIKVEPFKYLGWLRGSECTLDIVNPIKKSLETFSLPNGAPTPEEGVTAEVIYLGLGRVEDFEREWDNIEGKITLVRAGGPLGNQVYRIGKHTRSAEAGAVGYIYMNSMPGGLISSGTVRGEVSMRTGCPALGVSWETGNRILRWLERGKVTMKIRVPGNKFLPDHTSWNVVGDVPGSEYPDNHTLVGAHWDGHDIGDGAMDDSLGTYGILEVAKGFAKYAGKFKRTLRFVAFGVEEFGLFGSKGYAMRHKDELDDIDAMFNCDGFGRWGPTNVRVAVPKELESYLKRIAKEKNLPLKVEYRGAGGSDAQTFWELGVPTASFTGMLSQAQLTMGRGWDHSAADTVDKIDEKRVRVAQMELTQVLMRMANEDEQILPHMTKAFMDNYIEKRTEAIYNCRGSCIGYRFP